MQQWSAPALVMAPDQLDDNQAQAEGGRYSQFYNMSVFPYGGQFLGLVTHFRYSGPPAEKGPGQSPDDGPIDVQLVHSRDGRAWQRCEDRRPIIPNGPYDYDRGLYPWCDQRPSGRGRRNVALLHRHHHHARRIPAEEANHHRWAAWRRDGFVSLHFHRRVASL